MARIAVQPFGHVVVEELLAPHHAGKRLTLHECRVVTVDAVLQRSVELVGLAPARRHDACELGERLREQLAAQAHAHAVRAAGRDHRVHQCCGFGARFRRIHG